MNYFNLLQRTKEDNKGSTESKIVNECREIESKGLISSEDKNTLMKAENMLGHEISTPDYMIKKGK